MPTTSLLTAEAERGIREPLRSAGIREPLRSFGIREPLKRNVRDSLKAVHADRVVSNKLIASADADKVISNKLIASADADKVISNKLIASADADLMILDKLIAFEDAESREHQACLAEPFVTATTRFGCEP